MTVLVAIVTLNSKDKRNIILGSDCQLTAKMSDGSQKLNKTKKILNFQLKNGQIIGMAFAGSMPNFKELKTYHFELQGLIKQKTDVKSVIESVVTFFSKFDIKEGTRLLFVWVIGKTSYLKEIMFSEGKFQLSNEAENPSFYSAPDDTQDQCAEYLKKERILDELKNGKMNYKRVIDICEKIIGFCSQKNETCGKGLQIAMLSEKKFKWITRP